MPLLSYSVVPVKGGSATVTLDKNELILIPEVAADSYWSDPLNIKLVKVVYDSEPGQQKKSLTFDFTQTTPTASITFTSTARDVFEFDKIILIDFDKDKFSLGRTQIEANPSLASLDISVPAVGSQPTATLTSSLTELWTGYSTFTLTATSNVPMYWFNPHTDIAQSGSTWITGSTGMQVSDTFHIDENNRDGITTQFIFNYDPSNANLLYIRLIKNGMMGPELHSVYKHYTESTDSAIINYGELSIQYGNYYDPSFSLGEAYISPAGPQISIDFLTPPSETDSHTWTVEVITLTPNTTYNLAVKFTGYFGSGFPSTFQIPSGVFSDSGNNLNTASNTITHIYDNTAPVINSFSLDSMGPFYQGGTTTATLSFDRPVDINVISSSIYATGCSVASVVQGSNDSTYTVNIDFASSFAGGSFNLQINGGSFCTQTDSGPVCGFGAFQIYNSIEYNPAPTIINFSFTSDITQPHNINDTIYAQIVIAEDPSYLFSSPPSASAFNTSYLTIQEITYDSENSTPGNHIFIINSTVTDPLATGATISITLNSVGPSSGVGICAMNGYCAPGQTIYGNIINYDDQAPYVFFGSITSTVVVDPYVTFTFDVEFNEPILGISETSFGETNSGGTFVLPVEYDPLTPTTTITGIEFTSNVGVGTIYGYQSFNIVALGGMYYDASGQSNFSNSDSTIVSYQYDFGAPQPAPTIALSSSNTYDVVFLNTYGELPSTVSNDYGFVFFKLNFSEITGSEFITNPEVSSVSLVSNTVGVNGGTVVTKPSNLAYSNGLIQNGTDWYLQFEVSNTTASFTFNATVNFDYPDSNNDIQPVTQSISETFTITPFVPATDTDFIITQALTFGGSPIKGVNGDIGSYHVLHFNPQIPALSDEVFGLSSVSVTGSLGGSYTAKRGTKTGADYLSYNGDVITDPDNFSLIENIGDIEDPRFSFTRITILRDPALGQSDTITVTATNIITRKGVIPSVTKQFIIPAVVAPLILPSDTVTYPRNFTFTPINPSLPYTSNHEASFYVAGTNGTVTATITLISGTETNKITGVSLGSVPGVSATVENTAVSHIKKIVCTQLGNSLTGGNYQVVVEDSTANTYTTTSVIFPVAILVPVLEVPLDISGLPENQSLQVLNSEWQPTSGSIPEYIPTPFSGSNSEYFYKSFYITYNIIKDNGIQDYSIIGNDVVKSTDSRKYEIISGGSVTTPPAAPHVTIRNKYWQNLSSLNGQDRDDYRRYPGITVMNVSWVAATGKLRVNVRIPAKDLPHLDDVITYLSITAPISYNKGTSLNLPGLYTNPQPVSQLWPLNQEDNTYGYPYIFGYSSAVKLIPWKDGVNTRYTPYQWSRYSSEVTSSPEYGGGGTQTVVIVQIPTSNKPDIYIRFNRIDKRPLLLANTTTFPGGSTFGRNYPNEVDPNRKMRRISTTNYVHSNTGSSDYDSVYGNFNNNSKVTPRYVATLFLPRLGDDPDPTVAYGGNGATSSGGYGINKIISSPNNLNGEATASRFAIEDSPTTKSRNVSGKRITGLSMIDPRVLIFASNNFIAFPEYNLIRNKAASTGTLVSAGGWGPLNYFRMKATFKLFKTKLKQSLEGEVVNIPGASWNNSFDWSLKESDLPHRLFIGDNSCKQTSITFDGIYTYINFTDLSSFKTIEVFDKYSPNVGGSNIGTGVTLGKRIISIIRNTDGTYSTTKNNLLTGNGLSISARDYLISTVLIVGNSVRIEGRTSDGLFDPKDISEFIEGYVTESAGSPLDGNGLYDLSQYPQGWVGQELIYESEVEVPAMIVEGSATGNNNTSFWNSYVTNNSNNYSYEIPLPYITAVEEALDSGYYLIAAIGGIKWPDGSYLTNKWKTGPSTFVDGVSSFEVKFATRTAYNDTVIPKASSQQFSNALTVKNTILGYGSGNTIYIFRATGVTVGQSIESNYLPSGTTVTGVIVNGYGVTVSNNLDGGYVGPLTVTFGYSSPSINDSNSDALSESYVLTSDAIYPADSKWVVANNLNVNITGFSENSDYPTGYISNVTEAGIDTGLNDFWGKNATIFNAIWSTSNTLTLTNEVFKEYTSLSVNINSGATQNFPFYGNILVNNSNPITITAMITPFTDIQGAAQNSITSFGTSNLDFYQYDAENNPTGEVITATVVVTPFSIKITWPSVPSNTVTYVSFSYKLVRSS